MKKIGIIGYGRFGKVLHDLLLKTFDVLVYDFNKSMKDIELSSLEEVLDFLYINDIKWGIVTNKSSYFVNTIIEKIKCN